MADIHSQLEANGLPTSFGKPSDQPVEEPSVANIAATTANSDVLPSSDLKSAIDLPLEPSTLLEPVTPNQSSQPTESQSAVKNDNATLTNGDRPEVKALSGIQVNGHATSPTIESTVDVSMSDSIVPSSMPAETSFPNSITTTTNIDQPYIIPAIDVPIVESALITEQPPTSDLRTEPHSDALAPEKVAAIEARKHEEDNSADIIPTSAVPPSALSAQPESVETVVAAARLPNSPPHSPPPAPEPAHATLPAVQTVPNSQPPALIPEEKPIDPAPTPVAPAMTEEDIVMAEAPEPAPASPPAPTLAPSTVQAQSTKTAREREDDEMEYEEPAAKRVKKDEGSTDQQTKFKIPDAPPAVTTPPTHSNNAHKDNGDDVVTAPRLVHMKKIISNLKKSSASTAFRVPVDYVQLNIPNYPDIVKHPMDLGSIDSRLKNDQYKSVKNFIADFELIVNNCTAFNGKDHGITQQALKMQNSFNNQMHNLPSIALVEPSKAEKKAMKVKTEPVRAIPPRRPSVTTPGSARSPKLAAPVSTPSFAPGPDGMPLIRRDSSIVDGRPKRAIVPPKRNSDFAGVRPKKKKYELQLKFCAEVLKEIANTKHWVSNQYFTHPVDPVALNIPTYFQIIKKPMDLGTVGTKLENNQYEKARDFEEDVRLVFKNCYKFNPEGDYVNQMGHQLEELFDSKWAQKDEWITAREPPSEPPSDAEDDEDDDDASEEADADSEDDRNDKIKQLQAQIEAMSKQMGELTQPKKKKKMSPPAVKKSSKPKVKKEKATSTFPGLIKSQDKKSKKSTSKPKAEKDRYVTFQEKQYISNGIGMLPERQMQEALRIIQQSVPSLANSDGEIELDIEEVPNHALLKLLTFVKKYAGPPPDEPEVKVENLHATAAPTKSRKNKPMSKQEQEAQIEELKGKLGAYVGPTSPDAVQSVEGNESSDDSADSEESEEE